MTDEPRRIEAASDRPRANITVDLWLPGSRLILPMGKDMVGFRFSPSDVLMVRDELEMILQELAGSWNFG